MSNNYNYITKKFPLYRHLSIDSTRLSKNRNYIHGLIEADITHGYNYLKENKKSRGRKISLTAWIIKNIADTISEIPDVQAIKKGNKLVIYKDVDILLAVETMINGESFPVVHVIRQVQDKTAFEISEEIQELRKKSLNEEKMKQWKQIRYFILLPWFIRKIFYRILLSSPRRRKDWLGTTAVTAVGMFGTGAGWGINLPNHTIAFTLGGITEKPVMKEDEIELHRFINITINIDHDIVDGAPGARFAARLRKKLERNSDF